MSAARASIDEVNRVLRLGIRKGNYETLGGFVQHKMQRIPEKGEKIEFKKFTLIVDDVTKQKIKSVKIKKNQ